MDVTEQAEEQRVEAEALPGDAVRTLTVHPPLPPPSLPPLPLNRTWLRLAYVLEFWVAIIAIYIVWSQVGGQAHLDPMAWYIKLICGVGLALCAVGLTRAMVEKQRVWNAGALIWLLAILMLLILMFYITYWYHLHEQDDQQTDDNTATWVDNRMAGHGFV